MQTAHGAQNKRARGEEAENIEPQPAHNVPTVSGFVPQTVSGSILTDAKPKSGTEREQEARDGYVDGKGKRRRTDVAFCEEDTYLPVANIMRVMRRALRYAIYLRARHAMYGTHIPHATHCSVLT